MKSKRTYNKKWVISWFLNYPDHEDVNELTVSAKTEEQAMKKACNILFHCLTIDEINKKEREKKDDCRINNIGRMLD